MEDKKELLTSERDYGTQILDIIRSGLSDDEIRIQLEEYHEKDIAIVFVNDDQLELTRFFYRSVS